MTTTHDAPPTGLARAISGKLLFLFILGDVLGAGIYALVGTLAGEVGGAVWVPLLVALVLASLTAASYAELVTKYPKAGGSAVFAQRAFGKPVVSFLVGFSMLAAGVTSVAGLALAFSGSYLSELIDVPATPAALVFLVLVALLNARGIKESLRANLVMTVVEVGGLLLIIALAAAVLGRGDGNPGHVLEFDGASTPVAGILAASVIAFYSYVGFETSANVAEEAIDPARTYPRALFGGLAVAGVVYVGVALAVSVAVDTATLSGSSGPLLEVVRVADVGLPGWLFSLIALIAVANGALLTAIMSSRLTYGMATDGLLPSALGRVLPGRRTPWVAIVVTTLVSMLLVLSGDLETLAATVVLLLLIVFISTNLAVLVLRKDEPGHRHFRTPTVLPVLGIVSCVVLLTQQEAGVWLRAGLLLAVGVVLHLLTRRFSHRAVEV
ncbi:APC family permease [Kineococcus radiotolerans]|uniref:Amino acid permease-associated region n=1 Tax=Kineococcus radiotolerans (strain ATCC BAA-149 / DSM 14245 / SRS30216) TaxID=266940 RepID=A6W4J1_KINRD|nr:APC family permease [Kineococcus radiotolerans]ABS01730.1 amino acid permease-associated region [Kineococcus radiotolerans SRS30216 = ATCC BAA-149]